MNDVTNDEADDVTSDVAIQLVTGTIPPEEAGITLMHEHMFVNAMRETRSALLNDLPLACVEASAFAAAGGGTIVECTSIGLGRQPAALLAVARATGVNVVMGTGFYRDPYLVDCGVDDRSVAQLCDVIVEEIEVGVADSGIRAGIIGEVGCDGAVISALEERALRAAARAQVRTGAAISTHAARWPVGLAQLEIFEEEGVDPSRVIIGHSDSQPDGASYHLRLAGRGCYVEFDTLAHTQSEYDLTRTVSYVMHLVEAGHVDKILLSHDLFFRSQFGVLGGPGYTYLLEGFRTRLADAGLSAEDFRQIMVANPARALAFPCR